MRPDLTLRLNGTFSFSRVTLRLNITLRINIALGVYPGNGVLLFTDSANFLVIWLRYFPFIGRHVFFLLVSLSHQVTAHSALAFQAAVVLRQVTTVCQATKFC